MIDFLVALIVSALLGAAKAALTSFFVMLLIGALHAYEPQIPAFGFVSTFLICIIGSLIVSDGTTSKSS